MDQQKNFIQKMRLTNFLSFGNESKEFSFGPLNVLIGPNASGKSNLLEAIEILHAAPRDIIEPIREGGGIREWLWKGASPKKSPASIEVIVHYPEGPLPLRYKIQFTESGQKFELTDEILENEKPIGKQDEVFFFYRYYHGTPYLSVRKNIQQRAGDSSDRFERKLHREELVPNQSVLSQRKDPDQYPELTYIADCFTKIKLYREWNIGRYTAPRMPQKVDLPEDFLRIDGDNLGLVINDLQHRPKIKETIISYLKEFHWRTEDITTKIHGGTVQLFLHEQGLKEPIPATRLSDGTLRFICILAILCHPSPPPLICIEEPEIGLHPDMLSIIAKLLKEASQKTQLIITTHSDSLVSELPAESVLVCEYHDDGTGLKRLNSESLQTWLEKYRLGELWRMGEIGGNP